MSIRANRRHNSLLTIAALLIGAATGCTQQPTKEECEGAFAHFIDVVEKEKSAGNSEANITAELAKADERSKNEFVSKCLKEGTVKQTKCLMKAKTIKEAKNCG